MRAGIAVLTLVLLTALCAASTLAVVYHDYYGGYSGESWTSWEEDYLENNKSHATPPFAPQPTFGGCYLMQSGTTFEDLDCDKIIDLKDNCLGFQNPDQQDQNQNGLGDACDVIVNEVEIEPPVVLEGRAFVVTATLTNYRSYDVRNAVVTVQVPELGLEQKTYVDILKAGDEGRYEFFLRLPDCLEKNEYDVVLFVEWPKGPGMKEAFYIPTRMGVQRAGTCAEDPTSPQGKSIINILDIQDVDRVTGGEYPFTIVNNEQESQAYVLTVEGTEDWGSYEIKPRALIVVPAGESRQGILTIYADENAEGEHGFSLILRSKHDAAQELLTARILGEAPGMSSRALLQLGIFVVAAILVLLGVSFFILGRKE